MTTTESRKVSARGGFNQPTVAWIRNGIFVFGCRGPSFTMATDCQVEQSLEGVGDFGVSRFNGDIETLSDALVRLANVSKSDRISILFAKDFQDVAERKGLVYTREQLN